MKKYLTTIALLLLGLNQALAGSLVVQGRTVDAVGCYGDGTNTCFAIISGVAVGPNACKKTQIRWDNTGSNGNQMLSTFMLAHGAAYTVSLAVDDTACFGTFPKLIWVYSDS